MTLHRHAAAVSVLLVAVAPARAHAQPSLDGPWSRSESSEQRVLPHQVKVAYLLMRDLEGNRNGRADDGAPTNLSTQDEWDALESYLAKKTADWGVESVTNLGPDDFPSRARYDFFRIEKALFLDRHGWKPSQLHDDFLSVTNAKVRGKDVADARIFVQTLTPEGPSNGVVFAGVSGYYNSHVHLYEVAQTLMAQGATVVLGDQYWGGLDTGRDVHRGGVPSGETIALTLYDVAAYARATHPDAHLAVVGHSLGGGLGVWGMSYLNGRGELSARITPVGGRAIEGNDLVPRDTPGAPLSAFLEETPNLPDGLLRVAGRIPGVRVLEIPGWLTESGNATLDELTTVMEGIYAEPEALDAVLPLAREVVHAVKSGEGPRNLMVAYHSYKDELAFFDPIYEMHAARVAAGIPSDLTVAPGSLHTLLSIPEMSRQAAEHIGSRIAAWFKDGKPDLGTRVAPVVLDRQLPPGGVWGQVVEALGDTEARIVAALRGEGSDEVKLERSVGDALDAWARGPRSPGILGALLRARANEAADGPVRAERR